MSIPSSYPVIKGLPCDHLMSVIFPHSFSIVESHASLAVPVVITQRLAMSVQLRVICPPITLNIHPSLGRIEATE